MSKKKETKKSKLERINIKMTKEELAILTRRAARHTEGNLSAWLRTAGLKYTPLLK